MAIKLKAYIKRFFRKLLSENNDIKPKVFVQPDRTMNLDAGHEPWKFMWMIKGPNKAYGPFSYEQMMRLFQAGKIKTTDVCYPSNGGKDTHVSEIVVTKKAS
ncbi:MAG TPA: hypothetical protein VNJ08_05710 [Bacteriovoracaceae bacterium]|nr:hypothetical protein [Bacteriovoracaceae bacterium]